MLRRGLVLGLLACPRAAAAGRTLHLSKSSISFRHTGAIFPRSRLLPATRAVSSGSPPPSLLSPAGFRGGATHGAANLPGRRSGRLPAMVAAPLSTAAAAGGGMSVSAALLTSAGVIGALNLAGFAATVALETHKLTDLIGTGAFVASALVTAKRGGGFSCLRSTLVNVAVAVWGTRLASFLFYRILNTGEDKRFTAFFPREGEGWLDPQGANFPLKLGGFWVIQAMWAWVVSLPVTLLNASPLKARAMGPFAWLAAAGAVLGFVIEAVSDWQKFVFKQQPGNSQRFISTGLWHYSRHPNYFGELAVWWSLTGLAAGGLGPMAAAASLLSPAFLSLLILKVSGVPLLEAKYDKAYANDHDYQRYRDSTNLMLPWWPTTKQQKQQ